MIQFLCNYLDYLTILQNKSYCLIYYTQTKIQKFHSCTLYSFTVMAGYKHFYITSLVHSVLSKLTASELKAHAQSMYLKEQWLKLQNVTSGKWVKDTHAQT